LHGTLEDYVINLDETCHDSSLHSKIVWCIFWLLDRAFWGRTHLGRLWAAQSSV